MKLKHLSLTKIGLIPFSIFLRTTVVFVFFTLIHSHIAAQDISVFNTNVVKSVDLYKGAFPANYGGRLSSILDIRMREGNDQRLGVQGSIGNIASNLSVEASIVKGKGRFILSGRRSYIDKLVDIFYKNGLPIKTKEMVK